MRIKFLDQLLRLLSDQEIKKADICLTTSAIFSIYGVRENKDIEFVLHPNARKRLESIYSGHEFNRYSGVIRISEHFSCMYMPYEMFGVDDEQLFGDSFSDAYEDLRVVKPELFLARKVLQNRKKDVADIELVRGSNLDSPSLWKNVEAFTISAKRRGFIYPTRSRESYLQQLSYSSFYLFGTGRIAKNVYENMCRYGLSALVKGFIVSEKRQNEYCGKKVFEISDVDDHETIVLLCIELHCQTEVQNELYRHGFINLIPGYQFWE